MPKKTYPLDIWEAEGGYYSKGHHSPVLFTDAIWTKYEFGIRLENVRHGHARWMPPGSYDPSEPRPFMLCNPGRGAFAVTYWEG